MTNEIRKAELERTLYLTKKELARLNEEKRDALDRSDFEEFKSLNKATFELNKRILTVNKALKEFAA